MSQNILPVETPPKNTISNRVRFGLLVSMIGLLLLSLGAKPEWFGLDRSPVIGFVQVIVMLIGMAFLCLGAYIGLAPMWGENEKSILADIGIRLISTGYVIALFSGMADIFGMTVQPIVKMPFFGPWQAAGMQLGMIIIAAGVLMLIPYKHLQK